MTEVHDRIADTVSVQIPPPARTPAPKGLSVRPAMLRGCAAAIIAVTVLVALGYLGWQQWERRQCDQAANVALQTARDYAVTLTSSDPSSVDPNITAILAGATGDFKDRYTKSSAELRKLMIDNEVTTRGTVLDSAIKSATTDRVEVLLVVRQTVSNSAVSRPGTDLTPVGITMTKVNGAWLASDVEVFGVQP